MPAVVIRADQLEEFVRAKLEEKRQICRDVAYELILEAEARAVAETNRKGLVDQDQFKHSWDHRRLDNGAELGNDAPYADVLEYGRRPNRPGPPLAPIQEWVERKLVPNGIVDAEEAGEAARAIRWAIHKRGMEGRKILQGLRPWMLREYTQMVRTRLRER